MADKVPVVQGEKFIPSSDAECMVTAIPPSATAMRTAVVRRGRIGGEAPRKISYST